jgi:hypothetical protein
VKKLIVGVLILVAAISLWSAGSAYASTTNDKLFAACNTNSQTQNSPLCKDSNTTANPVNHIIKVAADIVAVLTGAAAVIIIIIGGISLITSGGNSEAVANARKRITSALIGLVIVALAWTLITFVTDRLLK